jgi:hypothetical protein
MSADILNRLHTLCRDIENMTELPNSRNVLSEVYDVINKVQDYLRDALDIDMAGNKDGHNVGLDNEEEGNEEDGHAEDGAEDGHAEDGNAEDGNAEDGAEDGNEEDGAEDGHTEDGHAADGNAVGDPVGDAQRGKKVLLY